MPRAVVIAAIRPKYYAHYNTRRSCERLINMMRYDRDVPAVYRTKTRYSSMYRIRLSIRRKIFLMTVYPVVPGMLRVQCFENDNCVPTCFDVAHSRMSEINRFSRLINAKKNQSCAGPPVLRSTFRTKITCFQTRTVIEHKILFDVRYENRVLFVVRPLLIDRKRI